MLVTLLVNVLIDFKFRKC